MVSPAQGGHDDMRRGTGWGRGRSVAVALGLLALACASSACSSSASSRRAARPATPLAGTLAPGPDSPRSGLSFALASLEWAPPSETAGDLDALADTLRARAGEPITIRAGPSLGAGWRARARAFVAALGVENNKESLGSGSDPRAAVAMRAVVRARGEPDAPLPLARAPGPVTQRPRYDPAALELEVAAAREAADGAARLLVIDEAELELPAWNALETRHVGSCEPVFAGLAEGHERSLALVAPFLDHVDASLWQVFRGQLAVYLPELQKDLASYGADAGDEQGQRGRCGAAYREYVERFSVCLAEASSKRACAYAPRALLTQGALQVGMIEPDVFVPEVCGQEFGRDVRDELRGMARESARVVTATLDPSWTELADRLATVSELHGALAEICVPRRRRFSAADLDELHVRLSRVGELLSSPPLTAMSPPEKPLEAGAWRVRGGAFPVPGLGDAYRVAGFERAPDSLAEQVLAQARGMREFAFGRAVCQTRRETRPLAIALIDARAGALEFFGYFYSEELFCEGLEPLTRR